MKMEKGFEITDAIRKINFDNLSELQQIRQVLKVKINNLNTELIKGHERPHILLKQITILHVLKVLIKKVY